MTIPAAKNIPTAFNGSRFIRIGSSKANSKDYPERERKLFRLLDRGIDTIENTPADYQNLTFNELFGYYGSKGIVFREDTFEDNLGLRTGDGEYNLMAQLLSDNSHMPFPFNKVGNIGNEVGNKVGNNTELLNENRQTIVAEMRNNPNITKTELSRIIGISTTAIDKNIAFLKKNGFIERIGSNKSGYWNVIKS